MRCFIVPIFLTIASDILPPALCRRGGGGGLGGRTGGSNRNGGFGRGLSGARTSVNNKNSGSYYSGGSKNDYSRHKNIGGSNRGSGGYVKPPSNGGSWGGASTHRGSTGRWSSSGFGSRSRGNQFKNMVVGAAAGYLTYQAGKAIIRAATGPMMWNNRPYFWGSNYYRPSPGHTNMCRMPIDANDSQFGNIYFQDQTRPREITWGCGYYEYCCGYECCRGGDSDGLILSTGNTIMLFFFAYRLIF